MMEANNPFEEHPEHDEAFSVGDDDAAPLLRPVQGGPHITADAPGEDDFVFARYGSGKGEPITFDSEPGEPKATPAEQDAMDRPAPFLPFRRGFDGAQEDLPLAEQKAAGALFGAAVDELLETPDSVSMDTPGFLWRTVRIHTPDGQELSVQARSTDDNPEEVKMINLQVIKGGVYGGEGSRYKLGADGVVRRVDFPDPDADRGAERKDGLFGGLENLSSVERLNKALHLLDRIAESIIANQLARALRVQNQPVGTQEIEQMLALVRRADTTPHSNDA